jgi:plasmid stabilization system protein ParE
MSRYLISPSASRDLNAIADYTAFLSLLRAKVLP